MRSLVRETFENERSYVYKKAYERCLAEVTEEYEAKCIDIRKEEGYTKEAQLYIEDETNIFNGQTCHLGDIVWADFEELKESARGPVENAAPPFSLEYSSYGPVKTSLVENTSLVEDTAPVHDTAPVEDTSAPVEDTETECLAPDSVSSSPAAIATGQYTYTVTILESNLGVGTYRGLASGTQAEALTSVSTSASTSSALAPAVNDPVSKRNYEEYLDSYTEPEVDKDNKRVKTGSDSEPTGDAS